MSDRRKAQKNHIRAARDWLGQAEHSLDKENDVRGELNLMLAKAELAQVKDSPRSVKLKRWGGRLLPALVAVILVVAGMAVLPQGKSVPLAPQQDVSLPSESVAERSSLGGGDQSQPNRPVETAASAPEQPPIKAEGPRALPTEAAKEQPRVLPPQEQAAPATKKSGHVPDAETQKLMQSAGKALRQ